jgi:hypothetical protein
MFFYRHSVYVIQSRLELSPPLNWTQRDSPGTFRLAWSNLGKTKGEKVLTDLHVSAVLKGHYWREGYFWIFFASTNNTNGTNYWIKYRAIKIICDRVIHGFESVCRYLNYTLDLLSKHKIKRQLKARMVASLK